MGSEPWPHDEEGNPTGLYIGVADTSRGFGKLNFRDRYGVACSIQASSLATDTCIWFGADHIGLKKFTPYGNPSWQDVDTSRDEATGVMWSANTRMHLNREQVRALLPILQHFVNTGEVDLEPPSPTMRSAGDEPRIDPEGDLPAEVSEKP